MNPVPVSRKGAKDSQCIIKIHEASTTHETLAQSTLHKPRPLTLFDNFEVLGGVPTTVLRISVGLRSFESYTYSADGTRLAAHLDRTVIRVHDTLNNFSHVASTQIENSISFLDFWNSRNDLLVAVLSSRKVCFVQVAPSVRAEHQSRDNEEGNGLLVAREFLISHPDDRTNLNFFTTAQRGGKLWISERNVCHDGALLVTCVSEEGIQQLRVYEQVRDRPQSLHLAIASHILMATYECDTLGDSETRIWQDLNFDQDELRSKTVKIKGRVLASSEDAKYVMMWQVDQNEQHHLVLCMYWDCKGSIQSLQPTSLNRKALGFGIMDLKAEFLDRNRFPLETASSPGDKPLVGVMIARSAGLGFLAWDLASDEIRKEIVLGSDQEYTQSIMDIDYSLSSNMEWIATCDRKSGLICVFSLVTSAMIWSYRLIQTLPNYILPSSLNFDPVDGRLVVATREAIFAFSLPCLLDQDLLNLEAIVHDFQAESGLSFMKLQPYRDLLSSTVLLNILSRHVPAASDTVLLGITNSCNSSNTAAVMRINGKISVIVDSLEAIVSKLVNDCAGNMLDRKDSCQRPGEVIINQPPKGYAFDVELTHIFFCFDQEIHKESIAVFCLASGIKMVFIDINDRNKQEFVSFDETLYTWFGMSQTRQSTRVTCMGKNGVRVVDLKQRATVLDVPYSYDLVYWIKTFYPCFKCYDKDYLQTRLDQQDPVQVYFRIGELSKKYGLCDVSNDGSAISLGWDVVNKRPFVLTSCMTNSELNELGVHAGQLAPCWTSSGDLQHLVRLKVAEDKGSIISICICGKRGLVFDELDESMLNPHQARCLKAISLTSESTTSLKFDKETGCLWFIAFQQSRDEHKLWMVPFSPYSLEGCIPSLQMMDWTSIDIESKDIERCIAQFGVSFVNMPFHDKSNLHLTCENRRRELGLKLVCNANENKLFPGYIWKRSVCTKGPRDMLENAVATADDALVSIALESVGKQLIVVDQATSLMKEHFKKLWIGYRPLFMPCLENNLLCLKVCEFDVPSKIYTTKDFFRCRFFTTTSLLEWGNESNTNTLSTQWYTLNEGILRENENKGNRTRIPSVVLLFCIENVCSIGLKGIVRFLLFQNAPSHIFQTDLVKFVVLWKWEAIWKHRCLKRVFIYGCFLVSYSIYAICIAYLYDSLADDEWKRALTTSMLIVSMGFTSFFIKQEYTELKAYIKDGEEFEPEDKYWGMRYYMKSAWNAFEMVTYIVLMIIIPFFHGRAMFTSSFAPLFLSIVAFELALAWSKVWYFAQAFDRTGAFVLLIASVVKDCTFFLTLAILVLVGFGLSLFVVFQHSLNAFECGDASMEDCGGEIRQKIYSSFGNPVKAMLTLFYAMIGTFDYEVYFHSGVVAPFVILMFVTYLSTQMVIMFNMLIAIMNDTYDRVKTIEEQLLLLGKARFIDACEAALDSKEIEKLEKLTGRYLYVLFPKDGDQIVEDGIWQGRIKTTEDKIKLMMRTTKTELLNEMRSITKEHDIQLQEAKEDIRQIHELRQDLKQFQKDTKDTLESFLRGCHSTRTADKKKLEVHEEQSTLSSQVELDASMPSSSTMRSLTQHLPLTNTDIGKTSTFRDSRQNNFSHRANELQKVAQVQAKETSSKLIEHILIKGLDPNARYGDNETLLHISAEHNAIDVARMLISVGADIENKDVNGCTPLHVAAMNDSVEVAKELIINGADIDCMNDKEATPLYITAQNNSIGVAEELIKSEARINSETSFGFTPLYVATMNDSIDVAKELLASGANIESKANLGFTSLHVASQHNCINVAKELIARGSNLEEQTSDGWTPLHIAIKYSAIDVAKELIDNGGNVESNANRRFSPLYIAAQYNVHAVIKPLVNHGANIEGEAGAIPTPLIVASQFKSLDALKELIDVGARIEHANINKWTPLHVTSVVNFGDGAEELIANGANIESRTNKSSTPLFVCSQYNSLDVAKILIAHGANIEAKNSSTATPLYIAAEKDSIDVANELIAHGADVKSVTFRKWSPLHIGAQENSTNVAKELIKHGADIEGRNVMGETALYIAALNGSSDMAQLLLDHGAAIDSAADNGFTPLHAAASKDQLQVVKILLERGAEKGKQDLDGRTPFDVIGSNGDLPCQESTRITLKQLLTI